MSAGSPAGTAVTGAALAFGGLGFARAGWTGLRAAPAAAGGAAPPRRSLAWKALYLAALLFGIFVTACGILLFLSLFLGD